MLEFGTEKQEVTSNAVKREYILKNKDVRLKLDKQWELIVEQMAEEIAELRNSR